MEGDGGFCLACLYLCTCTVQIRYGVEVLSCGYGRCVSVARITGPFGKKGLYSRMRCLRYHWEGSREAYAHRAKCDGLRSAN